MSASSARPDPVVLRTEIRQRLAVGPADRIWRALGDARVSPRAGAPVFDPLPLLTALHRHGVAFVVIGGLAGVVHGSPKLTYDLDIAYEGTEENRTRLSAALREVRARPLGTAPEHPFELTAERLAERDHFDLTTPSGDFDCTDYGTQGFASLRPPAVIVTLGPLPVPVVTLDALMRMKRRAGRPQDERDLAILAALRDEIERLTGAGGYR